MGLDVGVVKIAYLDRPNEPVYEFLRTMDSGSLDEEGWGGGWEGNAFMEFAREGLLQQASQWTLRHGLGAAGEGALIQWISDLPWDGDTIMLHLNW